MPSSEWTHYPLVISNEVIFVLSEGYTGSGSPEDTRDYVSYCQQNGKFRELKYKVPSRTDAEKALAALVASKNWKKIEWTYNSPDHSYVYYEQDEVECLKKQVKRIKQ